MKLLVVESRTWWSAALRRALPAGDAPLSELRSLGGCDTQLALLPTCFAVVEVSRSNANVLLQQLAMWQRVYPKAGLAAVGAPELAHWRPLLLEAGAALTVWSPRQVTDLAAAIVRHAARYPQPPGNFAERIWSELPLAASA